MIPRRGIIGWISAAAGFAAGQAWDLIKTVQAAIPLGRRPSSTEHDQAGATDQAGRRHRQVSG